MASHRICAGLTGALLLSTAAAAQEPPKPAAPAPAVPSVAPVTVEATKPAELKKQTYSFVQTYAATTQNLDQLARWTQPVCVTVQGVQAAVTNELKARVEEVAKALGVGAGAAGCQTNVQVFFTDKPQALLDKVAKEHEPLLGYYHHSDRDRLKTVTHPIQAWYVTATGGSGGNRVGMTFAYIDSPSSKGAVGNTKPGVAGLQPFGFAYDDEFNNRNPTGCGDKPAFSVCLASEFAHIMVVVDIGKVQGMSLPALEDYVVMLTMAQPRSLDACNALPSVIDLFAKGCPGDGKDGLTRGDVAYLTSLYKIDLELRKGGQETDIADRMADMLLKADAKERLAAWGGAPTKTSAGK
jgi:hypothetical protein